MLIIVRLWLAQPGIAYPGRDSAELEAWNFILTAKFSQQDRTVSNKVFPLISSRSYFEVIN